MKALIERIHAEGENLGSGILKVDSFLNHQLDPQLTLAMGTTFKERLLATGIREVNKIVTAETSGIAPALATAIAFDVPLVYARKTKPITMSEDFFQASAPSRTKGGLTQLMISADFLKEQEKVIIIDDFLATGQTTHALASIVQQSGARLLAIGCVIEKSFEEGKKRLSSLGLPVISLAVIKQMNNDSISIQE